MSPNCLEEWRLVVAELNASMEVSCGTKAGATAVWATCLQGNITALSLACLLEDTSWRLTGLVERP
jgi:hypothetical protein